MPNISLFIFSDLKNIYNVYLFHFMPIDPLKCYTLGLYYCFPFSHSAVLQHQSWQNCIINRSGLVPLTHRFSCIEQSETPPDEASRSQQSWNTDTLKMYMSSDMRGMTLQYNSGRPTLVDAIFSYLLERAALSRRSVTAPHVFVDPLRVARLEIQFWWASKSQQNKYKNK